MTTTNTIITNFDDFSFDQLKNLKADLTTFLKDKRVELKSVAKEDRENAKEIKAELGKKVAIKGATVTADYKGNQITGVVVKVAEKTFTMETEIDDMPKKVWRYFNQVVINDDES